MIMFLNAGKRKRKIRRPGYDGAAYMSGAYSHIGINAAGDAWDASPAIFGQPGRRSAFYPPSQSSAKLFSMVRLRLIVLTKKLKWNPQFICQNPKSRKLNSARLRLVRATTHWSRRLPSHFLKTRTTDIGICRPTFWLFG
jgi:hypothetical protein